MPPITALAPATIANSSPAFTNRPSAASALRTMPTFAINLTINPRRCGGASGFAQARTYAAARPAAVPPRKHQLAPSGASVSRPFTLPPPTHPPPIHPPPAQPIPFLSHPPPHPQAAPFLRPAQPAQRLPLVGRTDPPPATPIPLIFRLARRSANSQTCYQLHRVAHGGCATEFTGDHDENPRVSR